MDFVQRFFYGAGLMPHGQCYRWTGSILYLNVISDILIATAYFAIPVGLIYFIRKRTDLRFSSLFFLFGAFIWACGSTHIMDVVTVYTPLYGIHGITKAITAVLSCITAGALFIQVPRALTMPNASELLALAGHERALRTRLEADIVAKKKEITDLDTVLANRTVELNRTTEDLNGFIYSASHDLKQPVANMEGLVNILRELTKDDPNSEVENILGLMDQSVHRFQDTVNDMTDLGRLQSRVREPIEPVHVPTALNDVLNNINTLVSNARAVIETDFDAGDTVEFPPKQFRSILHNLLTNAIKFARPGVQPHILITLKQNANSCAVLVVKDNGIGIDLQHAGQRIFEMFKRFHTYVEGSGLGLYIVKKLVMNNDAQIAVDSTVNQGSTFSITFSCKLFMPQEK